MNISFLKLLEYSRVNRTILYAAGIVLMVAIFLTVAGCYETDIEVIDVSSAVAVYGVTGTYNVESGGTMTISAVPHSNDYRFQEVSKDNKVSTGYLRLVPLQGDIYIVQAKYDNEDIYYLAFYRFTIDSSGSHYKPLTADVDDERIDQLAQQNGITIDWDTFDLVPYLEGGRAHIMSFLRAHAGLPFVPSQ